VPARNESRRDDRSARHRRDTGTGDAR
jgi:hypothetical protein